ncbi:DUF3311 domain-containing protein [Actinomadura logoneensis]|uniref:DUF3311 domain-containing protein n=1 Tax=Actinomadura logoneensis TaxID=2293572 RepID=A0A372JAT6_9ACTN|nr:DUF3311 domain-containing protein [Actinomadura logoneensis]RFU36936.1 DUF3311 domain-containing protein [Actinomadura logoneensis]
MAPQDPPPEPPTAAPATPRRSDHHPLNWLLVVPVVVPLLTLLFNHDGPRIGGFPAFYWMQFAFIPLGVLCTAAVYQATKRRKEDDR